MKRDELILMCWAPLGVVYMLLVSVCLTPQASLGLRCFTYCFVGIAFILQIILGVFQFVKGKEEVEDYYFQIPIRKIGLGYLLVEAFLAPITLWIGGIFSMIGVILQIGLFVALGSVVLSGILKRDMIPRLHKVSISGEIGKK